jgi:hypothetical protein
VVRGTEDTIRGRSGKPNSAKTRANYGSRLKWLLYGPKNQNRNIERAFIVCLELILRDSYYTICVLFIDQQKDIPTT